MPFTIGHDQLVFNNKVVCICVYLLLLILYFKSCILHIFILLGQAYLFCIEERSISQGESDLRVYTQVGCLIKSNNCGTEKIRKNGSGLCVCVYTVSV